jgi:hypothetical protein
MILSALEFALQSVHLTSCMQSCAEHVPTNHVLSISGLLGPTCRGMAPVYVGMPKNLAVCMDKSQEIIVFGTPSCTQ